MPNQPCCFKDGVSKLVAIATVAAVGVQGYYSIRNLMDSTQSSSDAIKDWVRHQHCAKCMREQKQASIEIQRHWRGYSARKRSSFRSSRGSLPVDKRREVITGVTESGKDIEVAESKQSSQETQPWMGRGKLRAEEGESNISLASDSSSMRTDRSKRGAMANEQHRSATTIASTVSRATSQKLEDALPDIQQRSAESIRSNASTVKTEKSELPLPNVQQKSTTSAGSASKSEISGKNALPKLQQESEESIGSAVFTAMSGREEKDILPKAEQSTSVAKSEKSKGTLRDGNQMSATSVTTAASTKKSEKLREGELPQEQQQSATSLRSEISTAKSGNLGENISLEDQLKSAASVSSVGSASKSRTDLIEGDEASVKPFVSGMAAKEAASVKKEHSFSSLGSSVTEHEEKIEKPSVEQQPSASSLGSDTFADKMPEYQ